MNSLRIILSDQLSLSIPTLQGLDQSSDVLMFCEGLEEGIAVEHHPKKLAFLAAAMRHFAKDFREKGFQIRYIKMDDPTNTASLKAEIRRAVDAIQPKQCVITEPSQWAMMQCLQDVASSLRVPLHILSDDRFLASRQDFRDWAKDKKQLRMEFFYRTMRKKHHFLMEADGSPSGGQWNYDQDNRKPPKQGMRSVSRISHPKSSITREVLDQVAKMFSHHFGTLEPFHYAVTRSEALIELEHFIEKILPQFGDYQDAMVAGEPYLNHSLLSTYLNAGLLLPLEICQKAEQAYRSAKAPLNAVEGFIRQILGWREYVRGIYWYYMPHYAELNHLEATRPLPAVYWGGQTAMYCMAEAVRHTRDHAYSHHIQRLMITGNFALLAGLDVKAVQAWYLAVYSDAHEWVEMPNTLGMALFGDGGLMGSKPYAASGAYIHRMSNFCENCAYDPKIAVGEKACPFNALYWDFMVRHQTKLQGNPRLPYVFSTWNKFSPEKQKALAEQAQITFKKIDDGSL